VQITQCRLRGEQWVQQEGRVAPGLSALLGILQGTRPVGANLYPLRGHGGSRLFPGRGLVAPR